MEVVSNEYPNGAIGKACVCCGDFYPISSVDKLGNEITYPQNGLGLCPVCLKILLDDIKFKKKAKEESECRKY